ncbi:MAG: hypothetical protein IT365_08685 [Candidatus Hydrogenedentes bacterium]|nr:hypothetical protein [Candidatus Hydrogenedentota bacterium]
MMGIGKRIALAVTMAAALLGCDRGWVYRVPDGSPIEADGLRYDLPEQGGLQVRAHGSLIITTLYVDLDIVNIGSGSIELDPTTVHIKDRKGQLLPPDGSLSARGLEATSRITVPPGGSHRVSSGFRASGPASDLNLLAVEYSGIVRDGEVVPLRFSFEKP